MMIRYLDPYRDRVKKPQHENTLIGMGKASHQGAGGFMFRGRKYILNSYKP